MKLGWYKAIFGTGPLGAAISIVFLYIFSWFASTFKVKKLAVKHVNQPRIMGLSYSLFLHNNQDARILLTLASPLPSVSPSHNGSSQAEA